MSFNWRFPALRTGLGVVPAYASISPEGTVYFTIAPYDSSHPRLYALNGETGRVLWSSDYVENGAAGSTPLIDEDGNLYVGDGKKMVSFTSKGDIRWVTPIIQTDTFSQYTNVSPEQVDLLPEQESAPVSAQFTSDGHLIFITVLGYIYILDRADGQYILPQPHLIEGIDPDMNNDLGNCLLGDAGCPVSNTPALDHEKDLIFLTLSVSKNSQVPGWLVALKYTGGQNPSIAQEWINDETLIGGSAASPALSADKTRLYTNDKHNRLIAFDAATGDKVWDYDLDFNAVGSPCVSGPAVGPDGEDIKAVIIPAAGEDDDGPLMAIADMGSKPKLLWCKKEVTQVGVAAQAGGNMGYTFIRGGDQNLQTFLQPFDVMTGNLYDKVSVLGSAYLTVGTSIGPNGEVITPAFGGIVYSFKPKE